MWFWLEDRKRKDFYGAFGHRKSFSHQKNGTKNQIVLQ